MVYFNVEINTDDVSKYFPASISVCVLFYGRI